MLNLLNQTQLVASLSIPDLSDPLQAPEHAMGQLATAAAEALKQRWHCPLHILRASRGENADLRNLYRPL